MTTAEALFRFLGPLAALPIVLVLALILRWAYGGRRTSLVERKPTTGASGEYGLLVPVASPGTLIEGEVQRRTLEDSGIRAALVNTADGPRVMVFPEHERVARAILAR